MGVNCASKAVEKEVDGQDVDVGETSRNNLTKTKSSKQKWPNAKSEIETWGNKHQYNVTAAKIGYVKKGLGKQKGPQTPDTWG